MAGRYAEDSWKLHSKLDASLTFQQFQQGRFIHNSQNVILMN